MRKPNRVMNAILAFQLKLPTFLKSHYLLHWGYEQLSISSAILDPLTFQFLVWLAGVWSPDMNWAWPWYLCLVWAILMDIMGVMDFKWLLSLYFRPVWHYNQTTGSWNFCFYIRQTLHLSIFFHCKRAIIAKSNSLTDTKLFKHIQNIKNLMYILEMLEQKQVYCSVNGQLLHG